MILTSYVDPLKHTSMYDRGDEDSEDSDGEGGLGNVSRVVIRPPGHSGKAKRGHLCFDAAFETGNLGRADLIGEFEYDLFLRPDTCNPRYRFWFNFTVDNVKLDQRVIFNIVNISKNKNLFRDGLTPIVKSTGRPKWQRVPKANVFYYKSAAHQNHYVLSFSFAFDKEDEVYQFALAPPYSYSRLQAYLDVLQTKYPSNRFTRESLTTTVQNRRLEVITVDQVRREKNNKIRVIFILARSHAVASPASYAMQGLLEFLVGNHPIAKTLRERFIFKVLPMMNPDGVFLGNNRCNLVGQDLNRTWNIATEYLHPTLFATKRLLREYDQSEAYQVDFVIDMHAHSSLLGSFIYGNAYEDVYRYERHLVFPKLLSANAEDWVQEHMSFNADERKAGSCRRFCCERLNDAVNTYSLEVSMFGCYVKGSSTVAPYSEDGLMRLGRNLGRTFLEYYRFINVLPISPPRELTSRRGRPRTHRQRNRSKARAETQLTARPKTTRVNAPISYKDLSKCYESDSNEGSPMRNSYLGYGFGTRGTANIYLKEDQYSLCNIKSSKFSALDFSGAAAATTGKDTLPGRGNYPRNAREEGEQIRIPPKPYVTIIDFNQLTRGGLERAKGKSFDSAEKCLKQTTTRKSLRGD